MEPIINYNINNKSNKNINNNHNCKNSNSNSIESTPTSSPISLESSVHSHQIMKRSSGSKSQQQLQQLQEHEQRHQISDCLTTVASPKPNQVGTVLLYGIPIVSLYIESQERLCLAQISNTLLKTFSYNEIHNRRVALGITCVQCTPVQLEILRRAGAMPVSSRRCGMITRREAERLCKSFLGDNAPPRLPDDFAFSVHHECAWGCRGSFLPSRYNSSRAKCIKCSYCGLFFSPNKFIFHSHRIGPGDKYVQPDAANFNSWRRHMKLSGNPPEEITHAWEDVKAMFNGGTRKRLMTNSPTTSSASQNTPSPPKRLKENELSQPLMHAAAAAAAVVTANASQFPMRPLNIHHHHQHSTTTSAAMTTASNNLNTRIPSMVGTTAVAAAAAAELSSLPFSRNFMMDYMWHAHQNKSNTFQFPNYALPFIKRPTSTLIFSAPNSTSGSPVRNSQIASLPPTNEKPSTPNSCSNDGGPTVTNNDGGFSMQGESKSLSSFYNNSAFKPVIQAGVRPSIAFPSPADLSIAAAAVAAVAASAASNGNRVNSHGGSITSVDDDQRTISHDGDFSSNCEDNNLRKIKECLSSDDEMVDIETTEEEKPQQSINAINTINESFNAVPLTCIRIKKNNGDCSPLSAININLPDSPPIEIENSNDGIAWDGIMKKEHSMAKSNGNNNNFRSITPAQSLLSHSPASSLASGDSHQAASIRTSNNNYNFNNNHSSTPSTPPDVIGSVSPINDRSNYHQTINTVSLLTTTKSTLTTTATTVTAAAAVAIASTIGHHHNHNHHSAVMHPHHLSGHNHHQLHSTQQQQHHHHFQHMSNGGHLTSNETPSPPDTRPCISTSCNNNSHNSSVTNGNVNNTNNSLIIGSNSNNSSSLSSNQIIGPNVGGTANNISNNNNAEFWSVARLSFDRQNEYHRLPSFYRHHHDITKHFQAFRYHGHETTTHTNGIG